MIAIAPLHSTAWFSLRGNLLGSDYRRHRANHRERQNSRRSVESVPLGSSTATVTARPPVPAHPRHSRPLPSKYDELGDLLRNTSGFFGSGSNNPWEAHHDGREANLGPGDLGSRYEVVKLVYS
jgi:hypothetical protein